jgi:hypothetical protein
MNEQQEKEIPRTIPGFTKFIAVEIIRQKKWWLWPMWILLVAFALIIFLGGSSSLLPAIYVGF